MVSLPRAPGDVTAELVPNLLHVIDPQTMWLLTGPFDSEQVNGEYPTKTKLLKLLKTVATYTVGRSEDCTLWIKSKKISRVHGELIVGSYPEDSISDIASTPTLTYRNTRSMEVRVTRGDKSFIVPTQTNRGLESGDIVRLVTGVTFTVVWLPVVCFVPEEGSTFTPNRELCADLGIKLTTKHTRDVTHHLIPTISFPLPNNVLLSLLNNAAIVTPQWLITLLDSANLLYQTYNPPLEADYPPDIDAQFSAIQQNSNPFLPNGNRKTLFEGLTFIFAVIGSGIGSETKAMADTVLRGGGERNLVDVEKEAAGTASKNSWHALLRKKAPVTRRDLKSGIVLVGEDEKMHQRGTPRDIQKAWDKMVEKANIIGLRVIHPSVVSDAILKADVSLLDCTTVSEEIRKQSSMSQIRSDVPVRQEDRPVDKEPSQQDAPSTSQPTRRLTRRAASKPSVVDITPPSPPPVVTVAQEPSTSVAENKRKEPDSGLEEDSAPKKKMLKRRAKTTGLVNALLGLDEHSTEDQPISSKEAAALEGAVDALVTAVPVPLPSVVESQPRRPLKRRARNNSQSQISFLPEEDGPGAPSLKKFKTLFEESGRGEVNSLTVEDDDALLIPRTTNLEALREEEEETQPSVQTTTRNRLAGNKRTLRVIEERVEESEDEGMQDGQSNFRNKRHVADGVVQSSQDVQQPTARKSSDNKPSAETDITKPKGAEPGKPDTDISFLKAIASLKRGKRAEDDFDREFNQLRISKPKLRNEEFKENEAPWTSGNLADNFERDIGIRGNFMQIVEMEVWRDRNPAEQYHGERMNWQGRDNHKKFKKKWGNREREEIPLEAVGTEEHVDEPSIDYRPRPRLTKRRIPSLKVLVEPGFDEDEEGHPILTNRNKVPPLQTQARSRRQEKPPSSSNRKASSKKPTMSDLDFEDEDEDEIRPLSGRSLRKAATQPVASSSRKVSNPDPLFIEDSEDEIEQVAVPKRALRSTQGQSQSQSQSRSQDQTFMDTSETLRSDPKEPSQTQTQTRGLKRKAALAPVVEDDEDDDDDVGTFRGFSRKRRK